VSFSLGGGLRRPRPAPEAAAAAAEAAAADAAADAAAPKRRLVIALPSAAAAAADAAPPPPPQQQQQQQQPAAEAAARPRDDALFRRLFSENQRRVAAAPAPAPAGAGSAAPTGAGAAPLLALRRAAMAASAAGGDARYEAVPVEDFGVAMLRGMGVDESAIAVATDGDAAAAAAAAAADDGGGVAPPMPGRGGGKREREHRGLGATANPLLLQQGGAVALAGSMRRAEPSARARATARAVNPSGLFERHAARAAAGLADVELAGRLVMVWQLEGVPGLQKILVRALAVAVGANGAAGPGGEEAAVDAPPQQLRTCAVGLRDVAAVDEASLTGEDAAVWAALTALVAAEEAVAREAIAAADAAAAASLAAVRGGPVPAPAILAAAPSSSSSSSSSSLSSSSSSSSSSAPAPVSAEPVFAPVMPEANWLVEGIAVRVVDERWRGGLFFRRKGAVRDVLAPGLAEVQLAAVAGGAEGAAVLLTGVPQAVLETALPKVGGRVLVVRGPHKGGAGELLQRDARSQVGAVRLDDDEERVRSIAFDDLAEFCERL